MSLTSRRQRLIHRWPICWQVTALCLCLILVSGCAVNPSAAPVKLVLFAPFEGRYREIGYEMLYAARLALAESGDAAAQVRLIPIDDGGIRVTAQQHAAAIALDPQVQLVITAGVVATHPDVLAAFGDVPVMVAGNWQPTDHDPAVQTADSRPRFYLTAESVATPVIMSDTDFVASVVTADVSGELFALKQFRRLADNLDDVTIFSSASLPTADFAARYQASDMFTPEAGLLSTLTYDAAALALIAISDMQSGTRSGRQSRQAVTDRLSGIDYQGINGQIIFNDQGYWHDAPRHAYRYNADGALIEVTTALTAP